jgi:hypothetical protein
MDYAWLKKYIPAGCLRVPAGCNDLPSELWILTELQGWRFFTRANHDTIPAVLSLPEADQEALLRSKVLAPFVGLFDARWIQLSFNGGLIRVYLFPHDVDRRITNRADVKLTKAMSSLLHQLDYSPASWGGASDTTRWAHPKSDDSGTQEDEEDCSLLDRFNNLPSPDPRLELVTPDSLNALAMQGIFDSKISGLQTSLYPHQRRSAALMLQREVEPGQMIDPRLRHAVDQNQQPWYFDGVVGLVLKEPRYYSGVSGGILAEEMGTGKTLICLTVILATKHIPSEAPEPLVVQKPVRPKVGSLVDMAAAAINRHSFPWKLCLASQKSDPGDFYEGCVNALEANENRACYELRNPLVETRTCNRLSLPPAPAKQIHLSSCSLIIVPTNLVTQWQQEIHKHTSGLKVITIADVKDPIPPVTVLLNYDIILFSQVRFERIERERSNPGGGPQTIIHCPLEHIRFKRCIIDEGHKLGTPGAQWKSDMMRALGNLEIAARWVVTGTPTRGLYGVDQQPNGQVPHKNTKGNSSEAPTVLERDDLHRIGNITSKFLKVRPWSNTRDEVGDTPADWNVYVMQPKHHKKSSGRRDCLKATLESLIIRNRLSDVSHHLPSVEEKIVVLDGSYQDKLSLNLFSMMIIFNSVQSQRTDQDYFFHARQQKALAQLVSNLNQASFFGGVFYSAEEISKSLETAETFLEKKEVPTSSEDYELLKNAIEFGRIAVNNRLKEVSNQFHAMPLYLDHFPGGNGVHWSLDDKNTDGEPVCTEAGLVSALQKYLNPCLDAPMSLKLMIESGQLGMQGDFEKLQALKSIAESAGGGSASNSSSTALAGDTPLGVDKHKILKSDITPSASTVGGETLAASATIEIAEPLAKTQIISTVSAKLSYLIDSIVKYQEDEQIIIFYDNDNVAYYLAGVLEIVRLLLLLNTTLLT